MNFDWLENWWYRRWPEWLGKNRLVCYIFSKVWQKRLWDDYDQAPKTIIWVTHWRSALVENKSKSREHTTFCFWFFK